MEPPGTQLGKVHSIAGDGREINRLKCENRTNRKS